MMKYKKIIIALIVTTLIAVSGLSLVASADLGSTIIEMLLGKAIEATFDSGDFSAVYGAPTVESAEQNLRDMNEENRDLILQRYYSYMQSSGAYEHPDDPTGWASNLKPIQFYCEMAARAYGAPALTAGQYHYMIWAEDSHYNYYAINVRIIYDSSHTNDFNYFLNYYN